MTAIEIQSSLIQTISGIHDISILEQLKKTISKLVPDIAQDKSAAQRLTPKVQRMCFGHGLDESLDEKTILETELLRKHL